MNITRSHDFPILPKDYAALCRLFLPRPVHDPTGYSNTAEIADRFAGFDDQMTKDQHDYFDLLCDILGKYDSEVIPPSRLSSLDLLKHLLGEHGLSGAALSRILGKSPALGPMILRGERQITARHAILLGKHFGVRADVFLA